ncbi:hypothetical protein [Cellulomonas sp. NPDC089187]|uniref:hypothetical protein n=1 Tax=Cellulomonas sp. NPDC089187 TaxID=3154970 RepID=UPI003413CD5E
MTERDTDRQQPTTPTSDPVAPAPVIPTAFGSAPSGTPAVAEGRPAIGHDAAAPVAEESTVEPAPVTGSFALPPVPSRRSLRGKPPVSTAAIPIVPAPTGVQVPTQAVPSPQAESLTGAEPSTHAEPVAHPEPLSPSKAPTGDDTALAADRPMGATATTPVTPTIATPAAPEPQGHRESPMVDSELAADPLGDEPAPVPTWHPITGAVPVVAPASPWEPVTGQQPVVPAAPVGAPADNTAPADTAISQEPATASNAETAQSFEQAAPVPQPSGQATVAQQPATSETSAPIRRPTRTLRPAAFEEPPAMIPAPHDDGAAFPGGQVSEEPVDTPRRRRGLWIALVVVAALVLGGATAWYLMNRDDTASEQQVVQAPSPTSEVPAVDRTAATAFAQSLPATVLQYALSASQDDPQWVAAGAVEAYQDTYVDQSGATLTVHSGQWGTAAEAQTQQASLAGALVGEVISAGAVTVEGVDTGALTVVDLGDGTGTAVWNNGSAVFVLTAPIADVSNAYAAFPM